jgi:hypothetical protein
VDSGEEECARVPLPCPEEGILNQFIVIADGNIDPENRPREEMSLKLGGRGHG